MTVNRFSTIFIIKICTCGPFLFVFILSTLLNIRAESVRVLEAYCTSVRRGARRPCLYVLRNAPGRFCCCVVAPPSPPPSPPVFPSGRSPRPFTRYIIRYTSQLQGCTSAGPALSPRSAHAIFSRESLYVIHFCFSLFQ